MLTTIKMFYTANMLNKILIGTAIRAKPLLKRNFLQTRNFTTTPAVQALKDEVHGQNKSDTKTMTMADVKNEIIKRLGIDQNYSPVVKSREHLLAYEPKYEDLPPRSMQDSFCSAIIPLSTNPALRNIYTSFLGRVRLGRLMEDMDLFAVWVCHNHLYIPKLDPNTHLPYTFVTILVDKIEFTDVIPVFDKDIRLSGHISWVGRSSMEIVVWLEQMIDGELKKITRALFLFVARNATNTKSAPVNPLIPSNDHEMQIIKTGEERKQRRQEIEKSSLLQSEPNNAEQKYIHDIFIKTLDMDLQTLSKAKLPASAVWLNDTVLSNFILTQPEHRNAHNTVFGGFLMRNALEVAWSCSYMFSKHITKLIRICDIGFKKPVAVNSFIKMKAYVLYTEGPYMQIIVVTNAFDAPEGERFTTNVFHYTFKGDSDCPEIIPQTYSEAMWFLEGRRKFNYAMGRQDVPETLLAVKSD